MHDRKLTLCVDASGAEPPETSLDERSGPEQALAARQTPSDHNCPSRQTSNVEAAASSQQEAQAQDPRAVEDSAPAEHGPLKSAPHRQDEPEDDLPNADSIENLRADLAGSAYVSKVGAEPADEENAHEGRIAVPESADSTASSPAAAHSYPAEYHPPPPDRYDSAAASTTPVSTGVDAHDADPLLEHKNPILDDRAVSRIVGPDPPGEGPTASAPQEAQTSSTNQPLERHAGDGAPARGTGFYYYGRVPSQPEGVGKPGAVASEKESRHVLRRVLQLGRYLAFAVAIWFALMTLLIAVFRFANPPVSALMLIRAAHGIDVDQRWVPLEKISPNLIRAVIVSEDGRFCSHWGIDPREVLNAIRNSNGGTPRGASTMTMQLAKNLFLWPEQSYVRKALEVPLTLTIDALWPKARIAEVYLNIVEWGPGIFGAEAAARRHFGRSADRLSRRQSALLAVSLPNPNVRKPAAPSRLLGRMASTIEARMRNMSTAANCVTKDP